jgi:GNAT superfamily N-acetyltransferase
MHQPTRPALPVELRLDGGMRLRLRHVRPSDKDLIREGLAHFSRRSTYQRFFTPVVTFSDAHLAYLTEVDGLDHVAIGALDVTSGSECGVGVARYIRLGDAPHVAEAAVSVLDAYQSRGIGSLLLAALSGVAAAGAITTFRAYVLDENRRFLRYLSALGAEWRDQGSGVVQVDVPVFTDERQIPDGPATQTARWAWRRLQQATSTS